MEAFDETHLMSLLRTGDRQAFSELVRRHLPSIEIYARRMMNDTALAQDIAQETMLVLWQRAADFNPEKARLTTWLHRVAHNRCIDLLRRKKREVPLDSADYREPAAGIPDEAESSSIPHALQNLPESQRTALVMTYYQNLSNREVALIMGLSVRAVESLLCRARGNLKKQLEKQL